MPPFDWDKLMAAKPTELSEDEMEEFYESLVSFNPKNESDTGRLQKLFDVSRMIMKAKNESCEEIMEEFEKEIKASKKKEMAMASKEKELQKKIKELEKYGGEGTIGAGAQRMVVDQMRYLERQNEELATELRDIQSELNKKNRAAENYSQKISQLEKDLREYREDNEQLKCVVSDFKMHMEAQRDKLDYAKGYQLDYREKLARKNRDLAEAMEKLQQFLAQSDAVSDKLREENEVLMDQQHAFLSATPLL